MNPNYFIVICFQKPNSVVVAFILRNIFARKLREIGQGATVCMNGDGEKKLNWRKKQEKHTE